MAAQSNAQQTFEELVAAVKQAESRGKRYAADGKTLTTSPKGALGEMQVMPKTVKDPGYGVTPAKDSSADEIARVGVDYLQAMKQKYGDTERALIAYNWGPGSTDKWIAAGANPEKLPAETRTYVQRVKGFLGGPNVSRETTAKKEPTPSEEVMTKALPAGTTAKASVPKIDMANMPASYKAAFALAALADTQDEENDRAFNENKPTETETFFASYKPVNHLASLDLGVEPIAMKDGGEVGEDLSKPYFGNPNIKKQGEAARRLAALRDVNTLPDPKTYAAVAGALGTRPDQMGFSVMHPKYKEIMDVADPAFAAGTALQIAPVAQGPGMGRMVGAAEKALEPAVRRTLEGGGKAAEMLQALAAPPSYMFVRARPEAAARHAELQAKGLSPEEIRAQNLTLVDNRGNLIEEISDAPAALQQKTASVPRNYYEMLKHPELESIYPTYDMPQVMMEVSKSKKSPKALGTFDVQQNMISGRVRDLPTDDARNTVRGTLLHEGQHAIQSMEGFTEGANPGAFIAYVQARQGKYNADPVVNANVIREMERAYPNIGKVADNVALRLQADKYMKYAVGDPDRYVGETLYRHMPGEVQAELARVRSNLSPEQLKATPHEVSMQQLGIDPNNILEMNKMGSRPDRYIGDVEYNPSGYMHGGVVHRADGSPEEGEITKFATQQTPAPVNAPATRSAKELDAYIKALNPGAKISYFPEGGGTFGYVNSDSPNSLNIQRSLSPQRDEETKLHELEHSLTFRAGDPLGRPKIKAVDNNYQAYYMLGDWRPMSQFTKTMVENKEKLEKFFGRPLNNAYFQPETLQSVKKQQGDTSALFDEQMATLSALEQITGKSLTRDPEMKKLFPDVKMMSVYDALTGPRQTRMDPRDLPPSTPQPAYSYRDNPVTQFLHKTFLRDNFYPYQKPVKRANGGDAEPTAEEIAAASTPAFIAQKSGIGRKEGNISKALKSGEALTETAKGLTMLPQNIVGAPVDLATMAMRPFGYNVEKPVMGSDWLKEQTRNRGLAFKPSDDPTLAGFYGAGDLASNLVNPAGATRAGVQAAEKTGEAAKMLARDFQSYNQQLAVPGASYAIRNKGTPFIMRPERTTVFGTVVPEMNEADAHADFFARMADTQSGDKADNPALANWVRSKVGAYLRRDFGTEQDQMVQAAEKGQKLHFMSPRFLEEDPYSISKHIAIDREREGFPKAGFAKTAKGQQVEAVVDSSIYPVQLQDLSEKYIPPALRQFQSTQPEMRLSEMGGHATENLKLEVLVNEMKKMFNEKELKAYGERAAIPKEYTLTEDTLKGLTPAQASNRVANKQEWVAKKRAELAGVAIAKDPQIVSHSYDNGNKWISPSDLAENPTHQEMVKDIGCAGGWCTDKSTYALDYGSGDNRLNILLDKKYEPRVQLTLNSPTPRITDFANYVYQTTGDKSVIEDLSRSAYGWSTGMDSQIEARIKAMPEYQDFLKQNQATKHITQIKGQFNKVDLTDSPYLKQIQDFVKSQGPMLETVDNLKGINMVDMRDVLVNKARDGSSPITKFNQNYMDRLLKANNNSYYADADEVDGLLKKVDEMPNNAARAIQMNLFQTKATGGMIERQPNDNRRYL
jgi:soluble lytic murein transglycosylase-like protein